MSGTVLSQQQLNQVANQFGNQFGALSVPDVSKGLFTFDILPDGKKKITKQTPLGGDTFVLREADGPRIVSAIFSPDGNFISGKIKTPGHPVYLGPGDTAYDTNERIEHLDELGALRLLAECYKASIINNSA